MVKVRSHKKNPAKIGRELINQGASTDLVSGISMSLSGQFGFLTAEGAEGAEEHQRESGNSDTNGFLL